MAVLISINGNSAGDGFLLAPLDANYDAEISLATDAGVATVTLQANPNPAGLVFSNPGPHNLTTAPTIVAVHSTLQSATRGDTIIEVLEAGVVVASFAITSIKHPKINFKGRFEARFATQPAPYNQNPMYTSSNEIVTPGWTWGLEGEPNFCPTVGNVPENLELTGMGRVIRLNAPISLRSHAQPVVSSVVSITGETSSGNETFLTGDPLIGMPVNFGPDTYFAGNREITGTTPEEFYSDAFEPMGLFQIRLGNATRYFRGSSQVSAFTHKATTINEQTRTTDSRPIATGLVSAATEIAEFGLPSLLTFSETRIDQLVADHAALPAGASVQRRNLVRRINHLLPKVSAAKSSAILAANPGVFTTGKPGTITAGWTNKEVFVGRVDTDLHALPAGSAVIEYLRQFFFFDVQWNPFSFHSDELCGHHKGYIKGDPVMTGNHIGDPHTRTVNGIRYDFQAVGEFILLRNGNKMEVQARQSPVATANPITDSYSGLTACVSLNTAVAARVGIHKISLQPGREGSRLQFYLNGKPASFPTQGLDLDGNRITTFDANGETGLRIDYEDNTVVLITPAFWNSHNVHYINVSVSNTTADEGIMGHVPGKSWLPRTSDGKDLGPRPADLHDRYVALYKVFADSWRVNDQNSLFFYEQGLSTKSFTDHDWPAEQAPCDMKPNFGLAGLAPLPGMAIEKAKLICKDVTMDDLNANCVFDVATTGDETFAKTYLLAQKLRRSGTIVKININEGPLQEERTDDIPASQRKPKSQVVSIKVSPMTTDGNKPEGTIRFYVNDQPAGESIKLDSRGRARWKITGFDKGSYTVRALYSPADSKANDQSWSPNIRFELNESTFVDKTPSTGTETGSDNHKGIFSQWYVWLILILLFLIVIWLLFLKS